MPPDMRGKTYAATAVPALIPASVDISSNDNT